MSGDCSIPVFLLEDIKNKGRILFYKGAPIFPNRCIYCGEVKNQKREVTTNLSIRKNEKINKSYSIKLLVPYCSTHLQSIKNYEKIWGWLLLFGFLITLAFIPLVVLLGWDFVLSFFGFMTGEGWIAFILGGLVLILYCGVIGFLVALLLRRIISIINPEFRDFKIGLGLGMNLSLREPKENTDLPMYRLNFVFSNESLNAFNELNVFNDSDMDDWLNQKSIVNEIEKGKVDTRILFYKKTVDVWKQGLLDEISPAFRNDADYTYNEFVKRFDSRNKGLLTAFFDGYPPKINEYLIGISEFFILTNLRFIYCYERSGGLKEIKIGMSRISNWMGSSGKHFVFI